MCLFQPLGHDGLASPALWGSACEGLTPAAGPAQHQPARVDGCLPTG